MTPEQIASLSQPLADIYEELENELMGKVAGQLATHGEVTSTAQWQLKKLAEAGKLSRESIQIIAKRTAICPAMAEQILIAAAQKAIDTLEPALQQAARLGLLGQAPTVPSSERLMRVLQTYQAQAKDAFNLVNTVMAYKIRDAYTGIVNKVADLENRNEYLQLLDKATGSVVTGQQSRQAALRQCIKDFSEKGLPGFVDKAGREWSPEAYINMDIRTTVNNVAHEAQFARMDDYGADLISVSSHIGARPQCEPFQGRVYSRSGKSGYAKDLDGNNISYVPWGSTSYGEAAGLLGINCGHQIYPFFPGFSRMSYKPYPKKQNDKTYSESQRQRYLERQVRTSKRECAMLDKLGDKDGFKQAALRLKQRQQTLRDFAKQTGRTLKSDRVQVAGFGKSQSRQVKAAGRKQMAPPPPPKLQNQGISGKISVTKPAAQRYTDRYDADKVLRPQTESLWPRLTAQEKKAAYKYTCDSSPFNRPLRGYDQSWAKFVGPGKVSLDSEGAELLIHSLTSAIDKTSLQDEMWLFRGSDHQSLAGLLNIDASKLSTVPISTLKKKFAGTPVQDLGFFSTGVAADSGFDDRVSYEILAPKGTKGIYAEPFSGFGNTNSQGTWDGQQTATSVGSEAELILQRGTWFKILDILDDNGKIKVLMEVIP